MIAIKDMKETPKDCKKCPLMGTDGTPTDYFKPMMCVAIWATKHEIKRCIGGKIRDDCPLVEIEERKVGKWEFIGDNCFRCTECGAVYTTGQFNTVSNYREKRLFPKGCPNCGAEMRGAENE